MDIVILILVTLALFGLGFLLHNDNKIEEKLDDKIIKVNGICRNSRKIRLSKDIELEVLQEDYQIKIIITGDAMGNISLESGYVLVSKDLHGNIDNRCGDVEINGSVTGDVTSGSGDIRLESGNVTGNIQSSSGDITVYGDVLGSTSSLTGDVKIC